MAAPSQIPPDSLLGGRFRLVHRIGRGGMGDVWVARNEVTEAEVAVKTLARSERSEVHDERFRREARLAAMITHRNVVRIFDLVEDDAEGSLGLVMELLRGGTLDTCIKERGPLSCVQALAVAIPILSALHHVHEKGIIHRDVKPTNIFFAVEPDGVVIPKILDFGIAKLPAASSALTMDGTILGTPHYMSPEQIRGLDLDGRSDMFSLAVVLYEMLTGTPAFLRDSAPACLAAVLEHELDPDPRIEPRVWVALSRALSKRPYERPATCAELANMLQQAVGATDDELAQSLRELRPRSDAIPETPIRLSSRSSSQRRPRRKERGKYTLVKTLGVAGAAAIAAVTATLVLTRRDPAPAPGETARAEEPAAMTSSMSAPGVESAPAPAASSSASSSSSAVALELDDAPPVPVSAPNLRVDGPRRPAPPAARPAAGARAPASASAAARGTRAKPLATAPDF